MTFLEQFDRDKERTRNQLPLPPPPQLLGAQEDLTLDRLVAAPPPPAQQEPPVEQAPVVRQEPELPPLPIEDYQDDPEDYENLTNQPERDYEPLEDDLTPVNQPVEVDSELVAALGVPLDPEDYESDMDDSVSSLDPEGDMKKKTEESPDSRTVTQETTGIPIGNQANEPTETLSTAGNTPTQPQTELNSLLKEWLVSQGGSKFGMEARTVSGMTSRDKKDLIKAMGLENKMRVRLANAQAEIGKAHAEQIAQAHDAYINDKNTSAEDYIEKVNSVEQKMQETQENLDSILKKQVDPERYIKNMPTTDRLMGALMAGLEAGYNAFAGTNYTNVIDQLNRNIQNDIQLQKQAILNEKESVDTEKNLLAQKLSTAKDIKAAEHQLHAETLAATITKINALTEGGKAAIEPEKAQLLNAALSTKLKEKMAQVESEVWKQQQGPGLKDVLAVAKELGEEGEKDASQTKYDGSFAAKLPNGKYAVLNDKADARKFREAVADTQSLSKSIRDLKAKIEGAGMADKLYSRLTPWDTKLEKDLASSIKNVQMVLKNILKLGVLAGPDMDIIESMTSNNPLALFVSDKIRLDNLLTYVNDYMQNKLNAMGHAVVDENQIVSPAILTDD